MKLAIELNWEEWKHLRKFKEFSISEQSYLRNVALNTDKRMKKYYGTQIILKKILFRCLNKQQRQILGHHNMPLLCNAEPIESVNTDMVLLELVIPDEQIIAVNPDSWEYIEDKLLLSNLDSEMLNLETLTQKEEAKQDKKYLDQLLNVDDEDAIYLIGRIDLEQVESIRYYSNGTQIKIDHPAEME